MTFSLGCGHSLGSRLRRRSSRRTTDGRYHVTISHFFLLSSRTTTENNEELSHYFFNIPYLLLSYHTLCMVHTPIVKQKKK